MRGKQTIKKWMRISLWGVAVLAVMALLLSAMRNKSNGLCAGLEVKLKGDAANWFVNETAIRQLVDESSLVNRQSTGRIDTRMLEEKLERNPWIRNAELFFDSKQVLHIEIEEREPALRVITRNGQSFYMDAVGSMLPLSTQFSASVPVFTGFPAHSQFTAGDSALAGKMLALAQFISGNDFWQAQVQQVDIIKESQFELVPTIGRHRILFGDTTDMAGKFNRLQLFYKKVAAVVGFDRYRILNVQFAGQIVAVKSGKEDAPVDTAKASSSIQNFLRQNRNQVGNGITEAGVPDSAAVNRPDTVATVIRDTVARNRPRPAATPPRPAVRQPPKPTVQAPKPVPPKPAARRPAVTTPPVRQQPRAVMRRGGN